MHMSHSMSWEKLTEIDFTRLQYSEPIFFFFFNAVAGNDMQLFWVHCGTFLSAVQVPEKLGHPS